MQGYFGLFSKRTIVAVSRALRVSRSDFVGLSAALFLLIFFIRISPSETTLLNILVPAAFAIFAYLLRGVNLSGSIAGAIVAFVFYAAGGWRLFVVLLSVFAITLIATKLGHARKQRQIDRTGGRSASQVMANLFAPTAVLLLSDKFIVSSVALGAALAALAELAADTVSSEIGEAFGSPTYLVSTWKRAEPGTDGGVSLLGTFAGVASALTVCAVALALRVTGTIVWVCAIAGVAGMFADSLLGAALERRGWLNNDSVNLLSTAVAAGIAISVLK
jgi:uncharacterized protein (TIGR00297 family)